jgi:hypothetical protein
VLSPISNDVGNAIWVDAACEVFVVAEKCDPGSIGDKAWLKWWFLVLRHAVDVFPSASMRTVVELENQHAKLMNSYRHKLNETDMKRL